MRLSFRLPTSLGLPLKRDLIDYAEPLAQDFDEYQHSGHHSNNSKPLKTKITVIAEYSV